jgi:hypothetical protein
MVPYQEICNLTLGVDTLIQLAQKTPVPHGAQRRSKEPTMAAAAKSEELEKVKLKLPYKFQLILIFGGEK